MNDASELNQTILQWLSTSPNARPIDLQIGSLSGDRPGAATLLHYLRYDIPLLKQSLAEVGLDYEETRVRELWEMSDVRNQADLEKDRRLRRGGLRRRGPLPRRPSTAVPFRCHPEERSDEGSAPVDRRDRSRSFAALRMTGTRPTARLLGSCPPCAPASLPRRNGSRCRRLPARTSRR